MAYYVIDHKVNDFKSWEKVYHSFEPTRKKYGVKEHYVLRSADNTDHVLVVGEGDLDVINTFLKSDELKEGMANAGIVGQPNIFVGDSVN